MTLSLPSATTDLNDRLKFCQSSDPPAFTIVEMEREINRAVQQYDKHRPFQVAVELEVQQDVQEYDWPEDAVDIAPVLFSLSTMTQASYSGITGVPEGYSSYFTHYLESPALVNRNQNYIARMLDNTLGRLKVDKSRHKLFIYPTPGEDTTYLVPVIKAHSLTGEGDSKAYETIPDADVSYILDWAEAQCLRSVAKAYAINNQKVGDRDIRGAVTYEKLVAEAEELEARFRDHFYLPVASRS